MLYLIGKQWLMRTIVSKFMFKNLYSALLFSKLINKFLYYIIIVAQIKIRLLFILLCLSRIFDQSGPVRDLEISPKANHFYRDLLDVILILRQSR